HVHLHAVFIGADLFQAFAAGHGLRENRRVLKNLIRALGRDGQSIRSGDFHGMLTMSCLRKRSAVCRKTSQLTVIRSLATCCHSGERSPPGTGEATRNLSSLWFPKKGVHRLALTQFSRVPS